MSAPASSLCIRKGIAVQNIALTDGIVVSEGSLCRVGHHRDEAASGPTIVWPPLTEGALDRDCKG
jgi:hypothetical protein